MDRWRPCSARPCEGGSSAKLDDPAKPRVGVIRPTLARPFPSAGPSKYGPSSACRRLTSSVLSLAARSGLCKRRRSTTATACSSVRRPEGHATSTLPLITSVPSPSEASHCRVSSLRKVPLPHTPEGAVGGGSNGGGGEGGGAEGGGGDGGPPHGMTCTSYRLMIRAVPGSVMLTYRPSPTHGTLNGPAVDAAVYVAHVTRCAES